VLITRSKQIFRRSCSPRKTRSRFRFHFSRTNHFSTSLTTQPFFLPVKSTAEMRRVALSSTLINWPKLLEASYLSTMGNSWRPHIRCYASRHFETKTCSAPTTPTYRGLLCHGPTPGANTSRSSKTSQTRKGTTTIGSTWSLNCDRRGGDIISRMILSITNLNMPWQRIMLCKGRILRNVSPNSSLNLSRDSVRSPAYRARFPRDPFSVPFQRQDPGLRRPLVPAYSVPTRTISSRITPGRRQNSQTEGLSGQKLMQRVSSAARTDKKSVSVSTSAAAPLAQVPESTLPRTDFMSARSAETSLTTPSPGPAANTIEVFLDTSLPPQLSYPSFTLIRRPAFDPNSHTQPHTFEHVVTPYNPDAFDFFLEKHNIQSYPSLTHNLRHGFPLGDHPNLTSMNIIPNHPSVLDYPADIEKYLSTELAAGRMSGPFSSPDIQKILRGPFQSSPFIVSVQPQGPGEPDKIRICRHLSKATKSVASMNSFISKEDFPTRFDTASRVADIVSSFILCGYLCRFGVLSF
jgi:hypothetical protein